MSTARAVLLQELRGLQAAVSSSRIGTAAGIAIDPGVRVLRRGAAITGLVVLESFVRGRTEEILEALRDWPAQYEDLPKDLRRRATIEALPNLQRFAKMLQRQGENYEKAIIDEVNRMATMVPPAFQFTKFIAGDYTGNISESVAKDLLRVFQVRDCWATMRTLSAEVGFGVPSVREVLNEVVRNRHLSAHDAAYVPTASDVMDLPHKLRLIAFCVDAALSVAIEVALNEWRTWVSDDFDWRSRLEVYVVHSTGSRFRVVRHGARRALKIVDNPSHAKSCLAKEGTGLHASSGGKGEGRAAQRLGGCLTREAAVCCATTGSLASVRQKTTTTSFYGTCGWFEW